MDRLRKFLELLCIQSGGLRHHIWGELRDKVCKRFKIGGVFVNVIAVNPTIGNKPVG
jgi:hypothetical protein